MCFFLSKKHVLPISQTLHVMIKFHNKSDSPKSVQPNPRGVSVASQLTTAKNSPILQGKSQHTLQTASSRPCTDTRLQTRTVRLSDELWNNHEARPSSARTFATRFRGLRFPVYVMTGPGAICLTRACRRGWKGVKVRNWCLSNEARRSKVTELFLGCGRKDAEEINGVWWLKVLLLKLMRSF